MIPNNITLRQLRGFVALSEARSFRRAASNLNISQSALSTAILQLEESLDVKLFDRTTRSVELTQIGHDVLPPIRRILSDLNLTFADVRNVAMAQKGAVTVSCHYSVATRVVPDVLVEFREAHPNVTVNILDNTNKAIVHSLNTHEADIGVCAQADFDDALHFEPVLVDRYCAVVPPDHELTKITKVSWERLLQEPFVAMAQGTDVRDIMDVRLRPLGYDVRPVYEASHAVSILRMVRCGLGVSALPDLVLDTSDEKVSTLCLDEPRLTREVGILTSKYRSLSPAASAFREYLVHALQSSYDRNTIRTAAAAE
ncbi:MAG: hypothetical protein CL569_01910 [Alphaproteobacteria bacterium]|nr:hypothetical protein [Alphaproteobacteria bacterium]|tara:strand:- start:3822 stop:4760 length:939 start_codon:yes stop_codon:yes gene_type:complete